MTEHWKELLPLDIYIVRTNGMLHEYDRKILTLLYQPLIGSLCYSLYMTLWGEIDVKGLWGHKHKHHHLMAMMQLNLKQIYEERKKLEGIGLLKTYVKNEDGNRTFIYELQPPLAPQDFFNDGVLNIYLYNRLGKTSFNKIKQAFTDQIIEANDYHEVTSTFNDVFLSLSPSELTGSHPEMTDAFYNDERNQYIGRESAAGVFLTEDHFDFSLFFAGISESLIPRDAITAKVKEVIAKLAFIYKIDPIEMKKVVIQSLDENDQINIEALRKAARDYYQLLNGDVLPTLVNNTQPLYARTTTDQASPNKEEQLIHYLDTVSPYQLLVDISGGVEPSAADLQIIENVMINQQLHPGVVNVLIHYVMLRSDMKLSKNYVERIAGHWTRKKIKTVKAAMDLAKEEHRQYQEWAQNKQKEKQGNQRNQRFSKDPDVKRRQLMLGVSEDENQLQETTAITDEDIKKSMQKMFDQLEGKEQ